MKRPLVLISILLAAVIAAGNFLFPGNTDIFTGNEILASLRDKEIVAYGTVKSCEVRDGYSVLVFKKAWTQFSGVILADSETVTEAKAESDAKAEKGAEQANWRENDAGAPAEKEPERMTWCENDAGALPEKGAARTTWREHDASGKRISLRTVRAILPGEALYKVGQYVCVRGVLRSAERASNPGQSDQAFYDRMQHISCRMSQAEVIRAGVWYSVPGEAMASLKRALLRRLREVYPDDVEDVLAAMLLGRKDLLTDESSFLYEAGGAAHMLVVSSLHLSILSMGIYSLLRKLRCPRKAASIYAGVVLIFYVILAGCSISALRAVLIYAASVIANLTGRTFDRKNALAFAAIVLLVSDPYYLFYSSFQLSFFAGALCIAAEEKGKINSGILLQFGIMPLTAWHFYEIPLLGVPVNLLLLPFLPAILITGAVGLIFGGPAVWPAVLLVRGYHRLLSLLRYAPGETVLFGRLRIPDRIVLMKRIRIPVGTVLVTGRPCAVGLAVFGLLFSAFFIWRRIFRNRVQNLAAYILLPFMIAALAFRPGRELKMTFLDVGQGDAIFADSPSGTMLVDGGSSTVRSVGEYRILPFIKYSGAGKIDVIAATHADTDHISGILEYLTMAAERRTAVRAGTLLLPEVPESLEKEEGYQTLLEAAKQAGVEVRIVKCGDSFSIGEMKVTVLGPKPASEQREADANAQSMVLSVKYGNFDVLLTGDTSGEGESLITEQIRKEDKTFEVLKVAHHGSRFSTDSGFLAAARPDIAVISSGKNNSYGHPHEETLLRLGEADAQIYRTDSMGAVTVRSDGKQYSVGTFFQ